MVTINGKQFDAAGQTLQEYLSAAGFPLKRIAVERNGSIVPGYLYDITILEDGDTLEVVSFVGGG